MPENSIRRKLVAQPTQTRPIRGAKFFLPSEVGLGTRPMHRNGHLGGQRKFGPISTKTPRPRWDWGRGASHAGPPVSSAQTDYTCQNGRIASRLGAASWPVATWLPKWPSAVDDGDEFDNDNRKPLSPLRIRRMMMMMKMLLKFVQIVHFSSKVSRRIGVTCCWTTSYGNGEAVFAGSMLVVLSGGASPVLAMSYALLGTGGTGPSRRPQLSNYTYRSIFTIPHWTITTIIPITYDYNSHDPHYLSHYHPRSLHHQHHSPYSHPHLDHHSHYRHDQGRSHQHDHHPHYPHLTTITILRILTITTSRPSAHRASASPVHRHPHCHHYDYTTYPHDYPLHHHDTTLTSYTHHSHSHPLITTSIISSHPLITTPHIPRVAPHISPAISAHLAVTERYA